MNARMQAQQAERLGPLLTLKGVQPYWQPTGVQVAFQPQLGLGYTSWPLRGGRGVVRGW
jgi:hypothetical protein